MARGDLDLDAAEVRRRLARDPPLRRRARQRAIDAFTALRDRYQASLLEPAPSEPYARAGRAREHHRLLAELRQLLDEALEVEVIDRIDHAQLMHSLWEIEHLEVPSYPPAVTAVPPGTLRPSSFDLLGSDPGHTWDDWDEGDTETALGPSGSESYPAYRLQDDQPTELRTAPSTRPVDSMDPAPLDPSPRLTDRTAPSLPAWRIPVAPAPEDVRIHRSQSTPTDERDTGSRVPRWLRRLFGDPV